MKKLISKILCLAVVLTMASALAITASAKETTIHMIYDAEYTHKDDVFDIGVMVNTNPRLDSNCKQGKSSLLMNSPSALGGDMSFWLVSSQWRNGPANISKAKRPALSFWAYYSNTGSDGTTGGDIVVFIGSVDGDTIVPMTANIYYVHDKSLKNGWNRIVLPIYFTKPALNSEGNPEYSYNGIQYGYVEAQSKVNYSKLNQIRIGTTSTGELEMRLDDIKLVDLGEETASSSSKPAQSSSAAPSSAAPAVESGDTSSSIVSSEIISESSSDVTLSEAGSSVSSDQSVGGEKKGPSAGLIFAIIAGLVIILGGAATAVYFLKFKKKG